MKKHVKKILFIEFLILLAYLAFSFFSRDDIKTRLEVPLDAWSSSYVEYQEERWYINPELVEESGAITFIYGPYIDVPKGDYTITVCYECDYDQAFQPFVYETNKGYLKSSVMTLDKASNIMSCDFRVTEDIDNFQVSFWYNGKGEFSISGISIDRNNNDVKRNIVYLLCLFLILNFVIYFRSVSTERRKYLLAMIGIIFAASIPVFYSGLDGHDLMFHLNRIEGIARELRYGNFPVRIQSSWMAEYGYPVSIYYGDVLLYVPAMFRMFGFSIDEAYKMFVLSMNIAGAIIAEQSFKRIFLKRSTSLLLTLVYMTASYRLVDVYVRTAVGEYCALIFLPLLALAAYNIYCPNKNVTFKQNFANATILALGMSGIITAHVLSAEMAAFVLLLVCIVYFKKTLTLQTIRTYVMAIAETLLLCAGFLVPFVDYYLNVSVEITAGVNQDAARTIQEKGANIGDFFAFFSDPFGDWYTALFNPGIVLMLALVSGIALWSVRKATKDIKSLSVLAMITLFMATNVFPWNSLSHDFMLFDLLAEVQFPWRYVGMAIILLTILLGMILERTEIEQYLKISKSTIIGVCGVICVLMTFVFTGYYGDNLERNVYYDTANLDTWDIMGEEYKRVGASTHEFRGEILGEGIEYIETVARKGCEMDVLCKIGKSGGTVTLPILNYKGYVVLDKNGNEFKIYDDENMLVTFNIPDKYEGMIYVRFVEPWYWTASFGVSMGTLMLLMFLGVKNRKASRSYN